MSKNYCIERFIENLIIPGICTPITQPARIGVEQCAWFAIHFTDNFLCFLFNHRIVIDGFVLLWWRLICDAVHFVQD